MIAGLSLGGYNLIRPQWALQGFKNGNFPATVYTRSKRGGTNGNKLITPTFASYQLVLDFQIVGNTFSDLNTQRDIFLGILGLIHSMGVQTLVATLSNGSMRQIDIKAIEVTGEYNTDSGNSTIIEVVLECEYPFFRGINLKSQDILIYNAGGSAIPMGIPLDMSAGHTTITSLNIENDGNYQAYPVFTFTGQLTHPSIINNTTGKTLSIAYDLATSGDSIVVDTYLKTVLILPAGNVGRQYASGNFWTVPPGQTSISIGNSNTSDAGKCNVSFYDTFLNI